MSWKNMFNEATFERYFSHHQRGVNPMMAWLWKRDLSKCILIIHKTWWVGKCFLWKKKRREIVPLILCAFDFVGRYIRRFIPEGLLSIYEQILTLIKHKMIWNKQLLLESYATNIALRVLRKAEANLGLLPYPTWSTLW